MGQDGSKSDRDSPRQSRQQSWQQNSRNPPAQAQTTLERKRNPYRYTGENLQNTVRPASVYPDLSRVNTATTQRVAPSTTNATITQRVAASTANSTATQRVAYSSTNATITQRVAPSTANTATTQRGVSPTVIPAQQDTSPATREGHFNCYSGANGSSQRVSPPTTNAATTQRGGSPTVIPAQQDTSPAIREGHFNCYSGANGSSQRVAPPTTNAATTQRGASPTVIPAQKEVSPVVRAAWQSRHLNCYGGANGSCARKETEEYVIVNNYGQQQFQTPKPSAPPAHAVRVFENSKLRPSRPPPPRTLASPSDASASDAPAQPAQNNQRSRSVSRVRSPDDRFNCPTCGLLLGVTIFFCQRGHSACKECQQGNRLCGEKIRPGELCRTPIGNTRNISVEAMVADHLVLQRSVCPNAGCTLSYNMADMAQHQRACPYGETDCPMGTLFGQCQQRYKVDAMASHFDAFHREQRVADFGKEMFIFNCMQSQKMFLIKNGPYNFLVHVKVAEQERNIYMTVQLFGTAVSASKWSYEFHVYNKGQPRRKFMFVDSCHSVATSVNDIFKEAKCAAIPLNFAMTFVNEGVLTYKFYVKKTEMNKQRRNNWKRQNQQV